MFGLESVILPRKASFTVNRSLVADSYFHTDNFNCNFFVSKSGYANRPGKENLLTV